MGQEIASYSNDEGNITPLSEDGRLIVYKKNGDAWEVSRSKIFAMSEIKNIQQLRKVMNDFIITLKNCKLFIGTSVTGVPYFELEKAEVGIWEFEGHPEQFLEYVYQEEQTEVSAVDQEKDLEIEKEQQRQEIGPKDLGDGHYQIFLTKVQGSSLGITSKQVVLPVLRKGAFYQLDIVCSHIPPWLEGEIMSQNLSSKIEKVSNNELVVRITKKVCTS